MKRAKRFLIRSFIAYLVGIPLLFYAMGAPLWAAGVCLVACVVVYRIGWVLLARVEWADKSKVINGECEVIK